MKDILKLSMDRMIGRAPKAIAIADEQWISQLPKDVADVVPTITFVRLGSSDRLAHIIPDDAEVLIVEVDGAQPATLDRIAGIRAANPQMPIIAAVANADLQLMRTLLRHGVSDVVALPFNTEELAAEIYNIGARSAEQKSATLAPVLSVSGSLGRSGSTSVLLHLAAALVEKSERTVRCCLIDFDVQRGQLEAQAGIECARTVLDLFEAEERLDADMLRNVAVQARPGVQVIAAPREIVPIEQVDLDQAIKIVTLARSVYDVVLVDMPSVWTSWSLSIAHEAGKHLLIVEQSLTSLRQARRALDLFREVGVRTDQIGVVVNRARTGRFVNISIQDVADTLGCEVAAVIKEDRGDLAKAIDEGKLVSEIARRSPFAVDVASLADVLLPSLDIGGRR